MELLKKYCPKTEFADHDEFLRDFKLDMPERFNFAFDVVSWLAEHEPERRALVWCDEKGGELILDFRELDHLSNRFANTFRAQGVKKGDAVMCILKGRWHFWPALLGLCKLGAVPVPATHMLQRRDLDYRLSCLPFSMILCIKDAGLMKNVREAAAASGKNIRLASVDGAVEDPAENPGGVWLDWNAEAGQASDAFARPADDDTKPSDTMLLYFTSGTAAFPKMVPLDYHYPLAHIATAAVWHKVRDGGLHYTVADTGWAKCAWGKLYGQWLCGAAVFAYDYEKFSPGEMMRMIAKYKVTSFCAPPTIYRMMIKEDLSGFDFSSLEECTIAGEPLNPEIYHQWLKKTGHRLREGYGQTETVISIATFPWMEPKPGSMGRPMAIYDMAILAPDDFPCEVGQTGEIAIRAEPDRRPPGLFPGYKDDPEKTAAAWHDGWYRTGDLAYADEDGYYWFVGRADDLIKSSGYKIGPFEVESALMQHPAVLECAITGVPDAIRGQVVKATVVCVKSRRPSTPEEEKSLAKELQDHVKSVTEPYKYPRLVEFVDELPKTISGKIQRREIRRVDQEEQEGKR